MMRHINLAFWMCLALVGLGFAQTIQTEGGFETMAQPEEPAETCVAPHAPRDLAQSAYIRNGYRAILRILAARHWQETGDCACVIKDIPWKEVVAQGAEFVTSDDPLRPFDTSKLRLLADDLEAERSAACEIE